MDLYHQSRIFIAKFYRPILASVWITLLLSESFNTILAALGGNNPNFGLWLGAGLTLLACISLFWGLSRFTRRPDFFFLLVAFLASGYILIANSEGISVFTWMYVYQLGDLKNFSGLLYFFKNLRLPISPVLGVLEFATYALTGSTQWVTSIGYQIAILGSFLMGIWLARKSVLKMYLAATLGLFLVLCIKTVHPGNPQTYDVFFSLFVMGYILFLNQAVVTLADPPVKTAGLVLLTLAGLSLALADLTRPFFYPILGLAVVLTVIRLSRISKRAILMFLLPVLILSGSWHAYQLMTFGQITWSNHSGFSLWRVWQGEPEIPKTPPVLMDEINNQPLASGRWANLNTLEHSENNQTLTKFVTKLIVYHPFQAANFILFRLTSFFFMPSVNLYTFVPTQDYLTLYRLVVIFFSLRLIYSLFDFLNRAVHRWVTGWLELFSSPPCQLILVTFLSAIILAVGDTGEESRFMISLLPMLAAITFVDLKLDTL